MGQQRGNDLNTTFQHISSFHREAFVRTLLGVEVDLDGGVTARVEDLTTKR